MSDDDEPHLAKTMARPETDQNETLAAAGPAQAPSTFTEPRFTVTRVLGRGGMGEVSLCRDNWLGREVARKRATAGSRDRFLREVELQARLDHPAIVPLFEATGLDGAEPSFTMRHVGGESLRTVLDRQRAGDAEARARWSRRRLLTDFVRVAEAIAFAHDRGIIHRDIKPDNIMLGELGAVYVLDWGVARTDDDPGPTTSPAQPVAAIGASGSGEKLTLEGTAIGTLGYMAPEQLDGSTTDARADVYALGAVLFELLTLFPLHDAKGVEGLIRSTVTGGDARASVRAPDADVPPELEAICVRATAQAPSGRHPDVRALVADVEHFLDGDRDLERRRVLSREHAERAAARWAEGDDVDARADATREVGRALAFDPDNAEARALLARLLLEPPKVIPPAVRAALLEEEMDQSQRQADLGSRAGFGWLVFLGTLLLMGPRSWIGIATALALMLVVLARGRLAAHDKVRAYDKTYLTVTFGFLGLLMAVLTRWFGPFVIVPGVVAGILSTFAMHPALRTRPLVVIALASFTLPYLAELVGLLPRSYTFTGERWIVHAQLTDLPPVISEVVMWGGCASAVIIQGVTMTKIREGIAKNRERLAVHAWQLDQLVARR